MLVGEAWGAREEASGGIPFVGQAGEKLNKFLASSGLDRKELYITNVLDFRPKDNDLENVSKADLERGQADLLDRLRSRLVLPNVVVPTGNTALFALTGLRQITKWRGSILESKLGWKCIPTVHPAAVLREPNLAKTCLYDWRRIGEDSKFPELRLPQRTHDIFPSRAVMDGFAARLRDDFTAGEELILSFDIENSAHEIICVAFSTDPAYSLTVLWCGNEAWIRSLLEHPCEKGAQNHSHDCYWLERVGGISVQNCMWDPGDMFHCLSGDTKVLTADCKWKKISEAKVGDELLSFDEFPTEGRYRRPLRTSRVTRTASQQRELLRVVLDDGVVLRGTPDHQILVGKYERKDNRRNRAGSEWKPLGQLKSGDEIYSLGEKWEAAQETHQEIGWLGGVFDGEGSLRIKINLSNPDGGHYSLRVSFTQNPGLVLEQVKRILRELDFDFFEGGTKCTRDPQRQAVNICLKGGLREQLRFLSLVPSIRLREAFTKGAEDHGWGGFTSLRGAKVVSTVLSPPEDVYDIATTSRTFVANGIVVHNCLDPNAGPQTLEEDEGEQELAGTRSRIKPYSLAYMASIFTREPYWKDEAKDESSGGFKIPEEPDKFKRFLVYNGKDATGCRELIDVLKGKLKVQGKLEFYKRHYAALFPPLFKLMTHGVRLNVTGAEKLHGEFSAKCVKLKARVTELAGRPLHAVKTGAAWYKCSVHKKHKKPACKKGETRLVPPTITEGKSLSNKLVREYFYGAPTKGGLGLTARHQGGKVTVNEASLRGLALTYPRCAEIVSTILEFRRAEKLASFVATGHTDADGRLRSQYKLTVQTGRLATSKNPMKTGVNTHSLDRELRHLVLPDNM